MRLIKNLIFIGFLFFFLSTIIYVIFFFNYENFMKAKEKLRDKPIVSKFYDYSFKSLAYLEDELDFARIFFKFTEQEPSNLNINMSASDYANLMSQIEFFKNKGFIKDELNYWRKAELFEKNNQFSINYKLHGTSVTPLKKGFFNFRIKFKKNKEYLNNERQLNLIRIYSESDENISTAIINNVANDIGLLSPKGETILVKINNVNLGLFYKQSRHGKEWFEKHKITNYSLLKNNDDWDKKTPGHNSDLDLNEKNIEISGSSTNHDVALGSLKKLFEAIRSENLELISNLIDFDYFAKFLAMLTIVNDSHMITGDNLKFIYDHTLGTFKVLFRHESSVNFRIDTDIAEFNNALFLNHDNKVLTHKLFKILINDNEFRKQRDIYLEEILDKKEQIIQTANNIYAASIKNIMFSNLSVSHQNYLKSIFFQNLNHNFNKISDYLNYAKIYISKERKNNSIELSIVNDSFIPVRLKSITFDKKNSNNDNNKIKFQNIKSYILPSIILNQKGINHQEKKITISSDKDINKILFENMITKKIINQEHVYLNKISNFKTTNLNSLISSLEFNKINFELINKNLLIKSGDYYVSKNIISPIGIDVIIEKGTKFLLSKNVSILFQGNLSAKGTKNKSIIVESQKKTEPFGTFAIVGKNSKVKTNLNYFYIKGGSEDNLEGMTFLGQLSIHNSNVEIENSKIEYSSSDDGANIRNSNIEISNTIFSFNKYDQLDLDFCNGNLTNNIFESLPIKSNDITGGDGLDLSGSNVFVSKNRILDLSDKGISVGEKTNAIIQENIFMKNNIAIAIKDESKIFQFNNEFFNNNLIFSMYVKKPFFKEPILYLDETNKSIKFNNKDYKINQGKILFLNENSKSNFYKTLKNAITSSRI